MKTAVVLAVVSNSVLGAGAVWAADDFDVLPDVYGACVAVNKSADGNVRNDCLSNASIFNKADGTIYTCEAHLAVNVEGLQLTPTVAYKKASCTLANPPSRHGAGASSVAYKGDYAPRRSPAGGAAGTVPARFYWRTRRDKLDVDVCFDFVGFRAFSGCVDAPVKHEPVMSQDPPAPAPNPAVSREAPPARP